MSKSNNNFSSSFADNSEIENHPNFKNIDHENNGENTQSACKFAKLLNIMDILRGAEGCPWDKEQNHKTLMPYLIEEAYEVIEALEENNPQRIAEELGDLTLQIVFHSRIGKEEKTFSANDVLESINDKMIRRHPHIFGNTKVSTADEVLKNWEEIKLQEKGCKKRTSLMDGIPRSLPALLYSRRLQERAAESGFDWDNIEGVLEKCDEETQELKHAIKLKDHNKIEEELGDLLFAWVNAARWFNINPEQALRKTGDKFIRRFKYIEKQAEEKGLKLSQMTLDEMEEIWQDSKKLED